ncbi:hypothetical protein ACIHFD_08785 [Nonomuraea sp. NPDC051941]|uniref:hypothetical protein n=1 Tax=Nonomuraea sp. NPDC051941 TaxID=3364373 RepID=UPI0037CB6C68
MLVRLLTTAALVVSTVITSASLAMPSAGAAVAHQLGATVAQPPIPIPPKPVPPDDDEG